MNRFNKDRILELSSLTCNQSKTLNSFAFHSLSHSSKREGTFQFNEQPANCKFYARLSSFCSTSPCNQNFLVLSGFSRFLVDTFPRRNQHVVTEFTGTRSFLSLVNFLHGKAPLTILRANVSELYSETFLLQRHVFSYRKFNSSIRRWNLKRILCSAAYRSNRMSPICDKIFTSCRPRSVHLS